MSTEIISLIISAVGVIISAVGSLTLVNWRIAQLEKKMDVIDKTLKEHNAYAQKFAEIAGDLKVITNEIQHIKEIKMKENNL